MLLIYIFYNLFKAPNQLIVGKFTYFFGSTKKDDIDKNYNISELLYNRLHSLNTLFSIVDNALPDNEVSKSDSRIKSQVSAYGSSELFADIELGESAAQNEKFSLNSIINVFKIIGKRASITGQLQKLDDIYILTAQTRGIKPHTWRVVSTDFNESWVEGKHYISSEFVLDKGKNRITTPESEGLLVYSMVEQLAIRIYTDLSDVGSKRWQAVDHFVNGIRYYRHTLSERTNHDIYLRRAEKEFFRAWQYDIHFDQCLYNLAIINEALGQSDSAIKLLDQTRQRKHIPSMYAYADMNSRNMSKKTANPDLCETLLLCKEIIDFSASHAAVFHLLSELGAKTNNFNSIKNCPAIKDTCKGIFKHSNRLGHIACAIAWKEFCLNIQSNRRDQLAKQVFAFIPQNEKLDSVFKNRKNILEKHHLDCLFSNMIKDNNSDNQKSSKHIIPEIKAVINNPIDAKSRYNLGKFYEENYNYELADREYDKAFAIDDNLASEYNLGEAYLKRLEKIKPLDITFYNSTVEQKNYRSNKLKYYYERTETYIAYTEHDLKAACCRDFNYVDKKYLSHIGEYHKSLAYLYKELDWVENQLAKVDTEYWETLIKNKKTPSSIKQQEHTRIAEKMLGYDLFDGKKTKISYRLVMLKPRVLPSSRPSYT